MKMEIFKILNATASKQFTMATVMLLLASRIISNHHFRVVGNGGV